MSLIELNGVTYSYPRSPAPALEEVTCNVEAGEFILAAGPSGGGKSTLLRTTNGLVPQFHGGTIRGGLVVCGANPVTTPTRHMGRLVGMVFQEPEAQAIAETVVEEIAFGMEQRGVARPEMHRRMDDVTVAMGIDHLRHRRLHSLSGGERQRVAVASALALEPRVLVLDEPTSQLDAEGADGLLRAVTELRAAGDLTVLLSEHRLANLLPAVDRVLNVQAGKVRSHLPVAAAALLETPTPLAELSRRLGIPPELTVGSLRCRLPERVAVQVEPRQSPGARAIRVAGLAVAYGDHVALRDIILDVAEGEVVALVGPNGSGKTTLLRALTGLVQANCGHVWFGSESAPQPKGTREITAFAGMVPQDPALALYRDTVREEIAESLLLRGGERGVRDRTEATLAAWNVTALAGRNPRDISVGQQQRVAIAALLAHQPPVWLLDEPTRGADGRARTELADRLRAHAATGGAAIIATHDMEAAAGFATRVVALKHGAIQFDLPARTAFGAGGPLETQVAQLVPGAIRANEVSLVEA